MISTLVIFWFLLLSASFFHSPLQGSLSFQQDRRQQGHAKFLHSPIADLALSMQQEHPFPSLHGLGGRQLIHPINHLQIYSSGWLQCSTQAGKERPADWLSTWHHVRSSAWGVDWVRTDHAQHIQVFSAGSIFSLSCFLTWPRGSTLFIDTCYSHLVPPGLSLQEFLPWDQQPLLPEYALQSCQRFPSPTPIPRLPQKQHNKEPPVASQRDLLLIFWKEFCTQEGPARGM